MADDKAKIVEGLTNEFDLLQDKLDTVYSSLDKNMKKALSDLTTDAQGFIGKFEAGQNIIASLGTKMQDVQKKTNKLSLDRTVLEDSLARAIRNKNKEQINSLSQQLLENKLALQQYESTQTLFNKLKQVAEEEAKITKEKKEQNTLSGALNKKTEDIVKKYKELTSVAAILKLIVDGALRFNKVSVDISHNLGYGAYNANMMALKMTGIAFASNNLNVNMKNLAEAMGELNEATGGVANYSADTLETQVMLTKQFGLTGEEAAGIYKLSVLTGQSSSKVNDKMVGAYVATRNASRAGVPFKAVMADAAKVSGQLQANLKANPEAIVKAVTQAKALGTSLEQVAKQGDTLLDFESSIDNELKAELLTGKQLNLERARAAALSGDQITLAQELNKNIGTYEDFTKMNVLQQRSLAEAVGLTADQLAEQLKKQKIAKEQGKSLADITKEEALDAEKRQNVQDRFNALVAKLQDLVGSIGILLQPVFWIFEKLTNNAWLLYTVLGLIALTRLPAIAKAFSGIGASVKGIVGNTAKMFSKEGRASLLGGGDKVKAAAETTSETGGKAGAGGAKAGQGIKDTLKGISAGIQSFSKVAPADIGKLFLSALALVALTPAIPALLLLQLVNGKLIQGALTGIGKGLAAMGQAMAKATPEILIAELLLAGLGLALWAFVPIVNAFVPVIQALGDVMLKVFTGIGIVIKAAAEGISTLFTSLGGIDIAHLLLIGPALMSVGLGLAALGAGGVISAIGSFLGGDPIAKIERLAAAGDGLQNAATGLQAMAGALTQVAAALSSIDTSKIEALDKFATNRSTESVVGGITSAITAPIKAIGSMIGGGKGESNEAMIKAINEVRDAVNKLYAKDTSIHMDGKKVGTTLTQSSHKVA